MSNSPTEKKAPNTPRSTAKAAMEFYTKEADSSSRELIDKARAARIVDEVFNDETLKEGYKRKLQTLPIIQVVGFFSTFRDNHCEVTDV